MKIYRFKFPKVSDGCRDYTISTLDVTAKNKRKAKEVVVDHLKKKIGAAINAISPEQAVRAAAITVVARNVEIVTVHEKNDNPLRIGRRIKCVEKRGGCGRMMTLKADTKIDKHDLDGDMGASFTTLCPYCSHSIYLGEV